MQKVKCGGRNITVSAQDMFAVEKGAGENTGWWKRDNVKKIAGSTLSFD